MLDGGASQERERDSWKILRGLVAESRGDYLRAAGALQSVEGFRDKPLLRQRLQEIAELGIEKYAGAEDWDSGTSLLLKSAPFVAGKLSNSAREMGLEILLKRGQQVRAGGYYRDAVRSLELCTALGAEQRCFFELGAAYSSLGDVEKSKTAFDLYLKQDPGGEKLLAVGDFLQEQYQFDEAEKLYEGAREEQRSTVYDRARILLQLKKNQPKEARALAENFLEAGRDESDWIDVAMDFQRYRYGEDALHLLQQGRESFPGSLDLLDAHVRALLFKSG